jgi:nucleotide-binding universal stress UspA family protein
MAKRNLIVVGVDTSDSSKEALKWGAEQARLTGADLRVVMSWFLPAGAYWVALPGDVDFEAETRKALAATVEQALGPDPAIPVEMVVVQGSPAPVLIEESQHADLLVVGSRGHGAFTGMLLGSVSEHCVSHAACPVVVVRGHRREASDDEHG